MDYYEFNKSVIKISYTCKKSSLDATHKILIHQYIPTTHEGQAPVSLFPPKPLQ